jgi:hypothetical protein
MIAVQGDQPAGVAAALGDDLAVEPGQGASYVTWLNDQSGVGSVSTAKCRLKH